MNRPAGHGYGPRPGAPGYPNPGWDGRPNCASGTAPFPEYQQGTAAYPKHDGVNAVHNPVNGVYEPVNTVNQHKEFDNNEYLAAVIPFLSDEGLFFSPNIFREFLLGYT